MSFDFQILVEMNERRHVVMTFPFLPPASKFNKSFKTKFYFNLLLMIHFPLVDLNFHALISKFTSIHFIIEKRFSIK